MKERLKNTKITHEQLEDVPDFSYGFNLKTLLEFKDYWVNKYDWRKEEKLINSFPHFVTQIEGLKIHFILVKPPAKTYKTVVQLLLSHGWPGSVSFPSHMKSNFIDLRSMNSPKSFHYLRTPKNMESNRTWHLKF